MTIQELAKELTMNSMELLEKVKASTMTDPSMRDILRSFGFPVKTKSNMSEWAKNRMNRLMFIGRSKFKGVISPLIPNTIKIFKILEPSTLPMAMPVFFLMAATIEVISSGSDVEVFAAKNPATNAPPRRERIPAYKENTPRTTAIAARTPKNLLRERSEMSK